MFLHAWDLAEDGAGSIFDWMHAAGLNTACLAANYHAGWFIHPQSAKSRAFMSEAGVCYFHPHEAALLPGRSRLAAKVAELARDRDWLAAAGDATNRHGLRLVAWVIGVHNTRLGLACPELTQENAFGDRLPHALCPANGEVREYLEAICRDIAAHYPVWAVQLESFGWMGHVHGHHHERDLVQLTPLEQELMGWCFCRACGQQANQAGVDMAAVRSCVKSILDAAFRTAPQRPKEHPRSMSDLASRFPELQSFQQWRKKFSHALIAGIKQNALSGTRCRLLLQSGFEPELAGVVDGFACGAYQKNPVQTEAICRDAKAALPADWPGLFQCFIQLGMGVPRTKSQLRQIIAAVQAGGCQGVNFYNHSESPPRMLGWLAQTLPLFTQ